MASWNGFGFGRGREPRMGRMGGAAVPLPGAGRVGSNYASSAGWGTAAEPQGHQETRRHERSYEPTEGIPRGAYDLRCRGLLHDARVARVGGSRVCSGGAWHSTMLRSGSMW